jgi:hypothetical protein
MKFNYSSVNKSFTQKTTCYEYICNALSKCKIFLFNYTEWENMNAREAIISYAKNLFIVSDALELRISNLTCECDELIASYEKSSTVIRLFVDLYILKYDTKSTSQSLDPEDLKCIIAQNLNNQEKQIISENLSLLNKIDILKDRIKYLDEFREITQDTILSASTVLNKSEDNSFLNKISAFQTEDLGDSLPGDVGYDDIDVSDTKTLFTQITSNLKTLRGAISNFDHKIDKPTTSNIPNIQAKIQSIIKDSVVSYDKRQKIERKKVYN